ncbi:hypothetical protein [Sulfitobacter dubius]|uniref:hypothetical protein n=1 Tax=Sulfitobacter dubius TaxID=218673 RepID=UPI002942D8D0|nr:hypothetical protein [Sulfitobacter dubius]WOI29131.1 hypothetical protein R1T39_15840 [Sulfitobacter dubius]
MYITIESYAAATGTSEATASRRLKGVAYRIPYRERGRRYYHLAAAVQTIKAKEIDSGAVKALTESARDLFGHDMHVEPEASPLARAFAEWLPSKAMRDRLLAAQNAFVMGVGDSRMCTPTIVRNLPPLRELFALCPPVMAWVLTGGTPPDAQGLAPAFAVSNNCAALNHHTNMQEAA